MDVPEDTVRNRIVVRSFTFISNKLKTTFLVCCSILILIISIDQTYLFLLGEESIEPKSKIDGGSSDDLLVSHYSLDSQIGIFVNEGTFTNTTEGISVLSFNLGENIFISCEKDRQYESYFMENEAEDGEEYISLCSGESWGSERDSKELIGYFNHTDPDYYSISNNESYTISIHYGLNVPLFQDNIVENYYFTLITQLRLAVLGLIIFAVISTFMSSRNREQIVEEKPLIS